MKWKKHGRIFNPIEHKLANNCVEYAQGPQALVFDDFVRIYFSTRERDSRNKYLSHVAFVEMDKQFKAVLKVSGKNVIPLGGLGCFDEHGIFPFHVLRMGDKVYGYSTGWNRKVSVSTDGAIGFSVSRNDGLTFEKPGIGPVVSPSLFEPFLVGDPCVKFYKGVFHMWYICGIKWIQNNSGDAPERVYKIVKATSPDGINWKKEGRYLIEDKLNQDECQAMPTIIEVRGIYHMFFCYREATDFRKNRNRSYRLGYAFSHDLINWKRNDEHLGLSLSETGWDSDMMCYPNVFECNDKLYLLYNGNEFGRYGFGIAELASISQ